MIREEKMLKALDLLNSEDFNPRESGTVTRSFLAAENESQITDSLESTATSTYKITTRSNAKILFI